MKIVIKDKLLIIVIAWLAALSGLFLFSANSRPVEIGLNFDNKSQEVFGDLPSKTGATSEAGRSTSARGRPSLLPKPTGKTSATSLASTTVLTTSTSTTTPLPVTVRTTNTSTTIFVSTTTATTSTTTFSINPTPSETANSGTTTTTPQSQKININTANVSELEKITGVGPVIAQRIIDYRNTNGPFQKIEDIKNVNGIGDIKFEKMKNEITI